jgi:acyl-CoA synthetase (AMP-forming)/AMP-acid ligase II
VIGIVHPRWIEAVVAIVVPRDGAELTAEELKTHTRARLAERDVAIGHGLQTSPPAASAEPVRG